MVWHAAEDKVLIFDVDLVELVAKLVPKLCSVKAFIVLTDRGNMHRAVCYPAPCLKPHMIFEPLTMHKHSQ